MKNDGYLYANLKTNKSSVMSKCEISIRLMGLRYWNYLNIYVSGNVHHYYNKIIIRCPPTLCFRALRRNPQNVSYEQLNCQGRQHHFNTILFEQGKHLTCRVILYSIKIRRKWRVSKIFRGFLVG